MDFDTAKFKVLYSTFEDLDDEVIEAFAEQALCYLSNCSKCQEQAWFLVVAHLLMLRNSMAVGGAVGAVESATRGSTSVSFAVGEVGHGRGWWLSTRYGSQYLTPASRCPPTIYITGGAARR